MVPTIGRAPAGIGARLAVAAALVLAACGAPAGEEPEPDGTEAEGPDDEVTDEPPSDDTGSADDEATDDEATDDAAAADESEAAAPAVRVTLEVDDAAQPDAVDRLVEELERRGAEVADDVEVVSEGIEIVVTLWGAQPDAADTITVATPTLSLALGSMLHEDTDDCGSLEDGRACDLDGVPHEVDLVWLFELDTATEVEALDEPPRVRITLDPADEAALTEVSGEAACLRDQGQDGRVLLLLDDVIVTSASPAPTVACGDGLTGGELQVSLRAEDRAPQAAEELADELARASVAGFQVVTIQEIG